MNVIWTYISPSRISQPATRKGKAARPFQQTSIPRLVRVFWAWKLFLLAAATLSYGPGYDTSTDILFDRERGQHDSWAAHVIEYVVLRLTRWDAIYFASAATRGHLYEQEWAFSWLQPKITSSVARGAYCLPAW
jgi:GPI mannosyltransferase 2